MAKRIRKPVYRDANGRFAKRPVRSKPSKKQATKPVAVAPTTPRKYAPAAPRSTAARTTPAAKRKQVAKPSTPAIDILSTATKVRKPRIVRTRKFNKWKKRGGTYYKPRNTKHEYYAVQPTETQLSLVFDKAAQKNGLMIGGIRYIDSNGEVQYRSTKIRNPKSTTPLRMLELLRKLANRYSDSKSISKLSGVEIRVVSKLPKSEHGKKPKAAQ